MALWTNIKRAKFSICGKNNHDWIETGREVKLSLIGNKPKTVITYTCNHVSKGFRCVAFKKVEVLKGAEIS